MVQTARHWRTFAPDAGCRVVLVIERLINKAVGVPAEHVYFPSDFRYRNFTAGVRQGSPIEPTTLPLQRRCLWPAGPGSVLLRPGCNNKRENCDDNRSFNASHDFLDSELSN